ncbi:38982_t:CDS:1, partial [Gigaspora margarita]
HESALKNNSKLGALTKKYLALNQHIFCRTDKPITTALTKF